MAACGAATQGGQVARRGAATWPGGEEGRREKERGTGCETFSRISSCVLISDSIYLSFESKISDIILNLNVIIQYLVIETKF